MWISRRTVLKAAGALPLAASNFGIAALAQTRRRRAGICAEIPPILFVHGNGDHAALWLTTLWRMESNGVPRDRMLAINFIDPLARTDDSDAELNKSSTEDQRRELAEAMKQLSEHRRGARGAGRQFARRLLDPQLDQEWRRQRRSAMPCCAGCPTTAFMTGTRVSATNSTAAARSCAG